MQNVSVKTSSVSTADPRRQDSKRSRIRIHPAVKVLVLALDSLGDLMLRQPLFAGLARGSEVTVVVRPGLEAMLPLLDPRLRVVTAPFAYREQPDVERTRTLLADLGRLAPELVVQAQFDPMRPAEWMMRSLSSARTAGFEGGERRDVPGGSTVE